MSENAALVPKGMPTLTDAEKSSGGFKGGMMCFMSTLVFSLFGFGIAFAVYTFGKKERYDRNMKFIIEEEIYWAYLGGFLVQRLVIFANWFPLSAKMKVMSGAGGNLRANNFLFTQIGEDYKPTGNIVAQYELGDIGVYNRSNRSLQALIENAPGWVMNYFAVAFVFPFPCMIVAGLICLGRIMHQLGYTLGFGSHTPGFLLATFSAETLAGMCLIVFLKGLDVF